MSSTPSNKATPAATPERAATSPQPRQGGNPFAEQAERRQQAMAAESERHATHTAHVEPGNIPIRQPSKTRNGA
ncbi:hypothetical protein [Herbaspirillum sp. YR522]|uniref:hypothetical protein n=1 Tax=Herbaspirillum sp. YR522 TaxID=1144342 RepID=UPI00026FBC87|nr:hypothetical protein [Herbaspirillum sp. YR522]EJM97761.1 hypothetical protein PMI40_04243 [Herbaspirillum sp. YR522]